MASDPEVAKDELSTPSSNDHTDEKVAGLPGVVVVPEDPAAPSHEVSSKRQRLSDLFTIVTALNYFARFLLTTLHRPPLASL